MVGEQPPRQSSRRNFATSSGDNRESFFWTPSSTLIVAAFVSITTSNCNIKMFVNIFTDHPIHQHENWTDHVDRMEECFKILKLWAVEQVTHLKPFILTAIDVLLILCFPWCYKCWVLWPSGKGNPSVIQNFLAQCSSARALGLQVALWKSTVARSQPFACWVICNKLLFSYTYNYQDPFTYKHCVCTLIFWLYWLLTSLCHNGGLAPACERK